VDPERIIVTTGSQQALDLAAKVFLDPRGPVLVDGATSGPSRPFPCSRPRFPTWPLTTPVRPGGPAGGPGRRVPQAFLRRAQLPEHLGRHLVRGPAAPGRTASVRFPDRAIEDDPYGELRFMVEHQPPCTPCGRGNPAFWVVHQDRGPGAAGGWKVADPEVPAKAGHGQTGRGPAYLHPDPAHPGPLSGRQRHRRPHRRHPGGLQAPARPQGERASGNSSPPGALHGPEGGMFLWVTLPRGVSAYDVFDAAITQKVAFVPAGRFSPRAEGRTPCGSTSPTPTRSVSTRGMRRLAACLAKVLA
jgi:2-aminoadipate transaminase